MRLCYEATAVVVQESRKPKHDAAESMVEATKLVQEKERLFQDMADAAAKAEIARLQESTKKLQEQVEKLSAKEGNDKKAPGVKKRKNKNGNKKKSKKNLQWKGNCDSSRCARKRAKKIKNKKKTTFIGKANAIALGVTRTGARQKEAAGTTKPPQGRKNSLHEHDEAASSPVSSGASEKEDASIDRLRERANILSLIAPPFHRLTPRVAPAAPRRPSAVAKALVPVPEQEKAFEGPSSDENLDLGDECSAEKFSTQDYIQWLRSKFDVALDEAPYIHPPADAAASQQVSPSLSPCLPPSLLALPCHSANARTLSRDCSRYASIHICPLLADLWLPGGSAHGL